jgi:hypothetical protein
MCLGLLSITKVINMLGNGNWLYFFFKTLGMGIVQFCPRLVIGACLSFTELKKQSVLWNCIISMVCMYFPISPLLQDEKC